MCLSVCLSVCLTPPLLTFYRPYALFSLELNKKAPIKNSAIQYNILIDSSQRAFCAASGDSVEGVPWCWRRLPHVVHILRIQHVNIASSWSGGSPSVEEGA